MNKETYILLADAFGYGPITTLINISYELKKREVKLIFVGPEFCLNKIKKEKCCDEYICMDYSEENIDKNINIFKSASKIIAVETTDILIYLINKYKFKNLYLIDNLFWMWDFLEDELKELKRYYISNVIPCKDNIKRIAEGFNNIKEVGSLRKINRFRKINSNNLMISLGGAKSYLMDPKISNDFYINTIKYIFNNKNINKFEKIYLTGGEEIISLIKENVTLNDDVIIGTFDNKDYLKKLYDSKYAILSPGLGNFNEVISTNINTMFLLPINYSQHLQRIKFKKIYPCFHYQENDKEFDIEEYLEESIGVKKTIDNLVKYDFNNFESELDMFFKSNVNEALRYDLYKKIDKNGIKEVVNDIFEE